MYFDLAHNILTHICRTFYRSLYRISTCHRSTKASCTNYDNITFSESTFKRINTKLPPCLIVAFQSQWIDQPYRIPPHIPIRIQPTIESNRITGDIPPRLRVIVPMVVVNNSTRRDFRLGMRFFL